ncbi:hypothetical protein H6G33_34460 [Calothrix sp. FACHB-1219]|uniref:hypothetical protein n=1 Tax=unclassified Calothrix TaxID=2619626 RepID=UPI0016832B53|nr:MULTISPECIES: hypothetical protein [unclassified Calothrix]MBD2207451.1 hypothetical protein [Calothrix sp. FACHB-168]MBD2222046.1 hypothetical protein [Calothrix sp. FACHB-1219]
MNLPAYITYVLMRLVHIECTLSEVQNKQYNSNKDVVLISAEIEINDDKVDFLKNKNTEVKERRLAIDAKARTLLTLTSILLGLVSSTTSLASAKSVGILAIFPIVLLFLTIYLLTVYFGVERGQTVDYEYLFLDTKIAKKILCNDMLKCQDYNERVTNFMIDLYRSALRYFSFGMLCIMIIGIGNIYKDSNYMSKFVIESITQHFANHTLSN